MSQIAHEESAVLAAEISESAWSEREERAVAIPPPPPRPRGGGGLPLRHIVANAVARAEAVAIRLALHAAAGDVAEAARTLSTTPATIRAKMQRYRISPVEFERDATGPI